jgi:hypothetical protein
MALAEGLACLIVLFFGALGPVFRTDTIAKVAGAVCVIMLTGLAARAFKWTAVAD